MCTPIGHSLAGLAVCFYQKRVTVNMRLVLITLLLANLADLDFIFGWVSGNPNQYHHRWTHSLFFILSIAIIVCAGLRLMRRPHYFKRGIYVGAVLGSHIVLDFFTRDRSFPYGVQLFWPVSNEFIISPVTVFHDVSKASSSTDFIPSLFCHHNLMTVLLEILILSPVLISILFLKYRRRVVMEEVS